LASTVNWVFNLSKIRKISRPGWVALSCGSSAHRVFDLRERRSSATEVHRDKICPGMASSSRMVGLPGLYLLDRSRNNEVTTSRGANHNENEMPVLQVSPGILQTINRLMGLSKLWERKSRYRRSDTKRLDSKNLVLQNPHIMNPAIKTSTP